MCCLGWRQLSRRPARLTRAAPASMLARTTVWREAARVLPRVAAAELLPCSLDAGCAGFYAGARHGVARGGACAASGGGTAQPLPCSLDAGCASFHAGVRHGVAREAAHVLPQVVAAEPSPCSLNAGCAGFYAGARHGVARGGTCAASGGGS